MNETEFGQAFAALTGNPGHFPWQWRLYRRFAEGDFPASCNLPTGLGKTSVIHIWLLALATAPAVVPRRLVYVVNRRTVVDQATREAENLRERLPTIPQIADALRELCATDADVPLAISTLRGEFADNGEWRADPARPAVVVGTVNMIGSRLLFSGYGCGFKTRPLHAGLLGQDVLLVHDEAHLEPAFQYLLAAIRSEQQRYGDFRRMVVVELTATSRGGGEPFGLTSEDEENETVRRRIRAKKAITLEPIEDEKKTADRVAQLALEHKDSGQAVLVYLRRLEDVQAVAKKLPAKATQFLTGTIRGYERDRLAVADPIFARFLPQSDRRAGVKVAEGTVYLICTSAGEVGVNLSADHLVCDLTPIDSMAQRFGRVNRFGFGDARIRVVHPTEFDGENEYEVRRERTLELLRRLDGDASPAALGRLDPTRRQAAFTPTPEILPTSETLFDAWALTTVRERLPGRPAVDGWLHGISDRELPETHVAWREEVELITGALLDHYAPEALLDDYPLKQHELLRDRTDRVFKGLSALASPADTPIWLVAADGSVRVTTLGDLIKSGKDALNNRTILLPPSAGGLGIEGGESKGVLDGSAGYKPENRHLYDVADEWWTGDAPPRRRRERRWNGDRPERMRLERRIEFAVSELEDGSENQEEMPLRVWCWYVRPRGADDSKEWSATREQKLQDHLDAAGRYAEQIATALSLEEPVRSAIVFAARHHDEGKRRRVWQNAIGNYGYVPDKPETVLAKSNHARPPEELNRYRHEFGSLIDVTDPATVPGFAVLPDETKDLALHLIAAHHGRGRPHFPAEETTDPERSEDTAQRLAREVPQRFARLQRKYGRWGLAYLESLVRMADILASVPPKEER